MWQIRDDLQNLVRRWLSAALPYRVKATAQIICIAGKFPENSNTPLCLQQSAAAVLFWDSPAGDTAAAAAVGATSSTPFQTILLLLLKSCPLTLSSHDCYSCPRAPTSVLGPATAF